MNVAFYHMYAVNDAKYRFLNTLNKMKESGLYDKLDKINLVIVGDEAKDIKDELLNDPKIVITYGGNKSSESDTLKMIWDFCQTNDGNILYLHSKGATRPDNEKVKDWVDYMEYFCIDKHEDCFKVLTQYDTCGVNLTKHPMLHYSGNFWWAKSEYIRKRLRYDHTKTSNKTVNDERWYCEFWLLDSPNVVPGSLHQSGLDHYVVRYPRSKYSYETNSTEEIQQDTN